MPGVWDVLAPGGAEAVWPFALLAGLFGLLVGSFLNVVIYRLPKMMERQWADECAALAHEAALPAADTPTVAVAAAAAAIALTPDAALATLPPAETFNLWLPRSRCGACGHTIRWYENIPVFSYLFLRGKCAACGVRISLRYPLVEIACGLLFFGCVWRWGLSGTAFAWCGFSAALLALALIDWDTTLLPDDITLPLLWAGLLVAAMGWNSAVALPQAVWGAALGYTSLWLVYWAFKLATGKEGMGFGDFKLFAALGAWFGAAALIPMILMASVIGAVIGIALKFSTGLRAGGYVPFGPFLAGAGFTAMVFGPQSLLQAVGL